MRVQVSHDPATPLFTLVRVWSRFRPIIGDEESIRGPAPLPTPVEIFDDFDATRRKGRGRKNV